MTNPDTDTVERVARALEETHHAAVAKDMSGNQWLDLMARAAIAAIGQAEGHSGCQPIKTSPGSEWTIDDIVTCIGGWALNYKRGVFTKTRAEFEAKVKQVLEHLPTPPETETLE